MVTEIAPAPPSGCVFHHIGYAARSIEDEKVFFSSFGYVQEGRVFSDPVQGVKGLFLSGGGPRIELLEDLPGRNTLVPWIQAGVRLYHLAYLTDDLDACLDWSRRARGKVVIAPVPSVAFGGRMISFVLFRRGVMIEFIGGKTFPGGA